MRNKIFKSLYRAGKNRRVLYCLMFHFHVITKSSPQLPTNTFPFNSVERKVLQAYLLLCTNTSLGCLIRHPSEVFVQSVRTKPRSPYSQVEGTNVSKAVSIFWVEDFRSHDDAGSHFFYIFAPISETARRHITEDSNIHTHRHGDLQVLCQYTGSTAGQQSAAN